MRWRKGLKSQESLKNITKETIVQFCTWDDIDTLPLPNALKDFLQGPPPLEYIDLIEYLDGSVTVHDVYVCIRAIRRLMSHSGPKNGPYSDA